MKKKKLTQLPKRQKVIPRHFMKRRKATLSEILRAASNGRRIKQLLLNNRALAAALEESQCMVASSNRMLQRYTVANTQVLMAQRKLKDMASTLQKFVGDLDDALNYLDVSQTSSTIFYNADLKSGICAPDLETIEESPRSSVASYGEELMEDAGPAINHLVEKSMPVFDTSVTEIYNVVNFLNPEKQNGSHETNALSPIIRTPPIPQFSPPTYTSKTPDFAVEKPRDLEQKELAEQTTSKANSNLSKIPVRRPNLFCGSGIPDSPEALVPSIRRETFVVNQLKDMDNCLSASLRRKTFTLHKQVQELQTTKKADLDGTFAIPNLPPQKPDPKPGNPIQLPHEICTGDMTVNLLEDMELTEIIPSSALASVTDEVQFNNFGLPSNKTAGNLKALPSVLNITKPISPIKKLKLSSEQSIVSSDHKPRSSKLKEKRVLSKCSAKVFLPKSNNLNPTNIISENVIASNPLIPNVTSTLPAISTPPTVNTVSFHKSDCQISKKSLSPTVPDELLRQQKSSNDPIRAVKNDLDVINECKKSSVASRKSVLLNDPKETLQQQELLDNFDLGVVKNFKKSNHASRKSMLPYVPKELSMQENQMHGEDDMEKVGECLRSKTSEMLILPDSSKKSSEHQTLSCDHDLSDETDSEAIKLNKSSRTSRKSILPNPKKLINQQNLTDSIVEPDIVDAKTNEGTLCKKIRQPSSIYSVENGVVNGEDSKELDIYNNKSTKNNPKRTSNLDLRKSVLPKISEISSNSSFSDVLPSDSELEVITPEKHRKRIPGRKSLKPGRRGPFIFTKTRKSNSKLHMSECTDSKGYEFSSSDEDEKPIKKRRQSKKPPKKSSKMLKNKNTVAVLERDIGLIYQEQGRRKRSLKRKVSFANINVSPTNSDNEETVKSSRGEIKNLENVLKNDDECEKTTVRRSILKKQSLPACSSEKSRIAHNISLNSEQSEEELRSKNNEEIETQTSDDKGRSKEDDAESFVNVIDKKMNDKSKEIKTDNSLSATTDVDKQLDVIRKSNLNVKQENTSSKRSIAKSHKNSEFFGFESKKSQSKRTFSGVSERSSKRATAIDDFLKDVDIPFPEENPNCEASGIKSLCNAAPNTHASLTKPQIVNLNEENIAVDADNAPSSIDKKSEALLVNSKTPVSGKSSKKSAKGNKNTKTPSSSDVQKNARQSKPKNVLKENVKDSACTPPPSKARKTGSTGSVKENLVVPDLESGGRSRRNKPTISFKEPSLNRKMRRN